MITFAVIWQLITSYLTAKAFNPIFFFQTLSVIFFFSFVVSHVCKMRFQDKKAFRNPSIYEKLIIHCNIDELGKQEYGYEWKVQQL